MDLFRKPCIPWNIGDPLHQKMEAQNRQRKCQRERAEGEREESYGEAMPRGQYSEPEEVADDPQPG